MSFFASSLILSVHLHLFYLLTFFPLISLPSPDIILFRSVSLSSPFFAPFLISFFVFLSFSCHRYSFFSLFVLLFLVSCSLLSSILVPDLALDTLFSSFIAFFSYFLCLSVSSLSLFSPFFAPFLILSIHIQPFSPSHPFYLNFLPFSSVIAVQPSS